MGQIKTSRDTFAMASSAGITLSKMLLFLSWVWADLPVPKAKGQILSTLFNSLTVWLRSHADFTDIYGERNTQTKSWLSALQLI